MKNKVIIIEDNDYRYFTTKAVLQSQMKLEVEAQSTVNGQCLVELTQGLPSSQIIFLPQGGVADLFFQLKRRNINRRNTQIVLVSVAEMAEDHLLKFAEYLKSCEGDSTPLASAA